MAPKWMDALSGAWEGTQRLNPAKWAQDRATWLGDTVSGTVKDIWSGPSHATLTPEAQAWADARPTTDSAFWSQDQTAGWRQAFDKYAALHDGAKPPTPPDLIPFGPGNGNGSGGAAAAAAAIAARRAAIAKLYDQMLATLGTNRNTANQQIGTIGTQLQTALDTIARQGGRQSAALNQQLAGLYSNSIRDQRADNATALAHLALYGANPAVLLAEQARQMGMLRSQGARTQAYGNELNNIRGQSMGNARAAGQTMTAGTRQQVTAEEAALRAQIERERLAAMASMAGK